MAKRAPRDLPPNATDDLARETESSRANFSGRRVLAFESRHAAQMQRLIESYGGAATVVPTLREVALRDPSVPQFVRDLQENRVDFAIFTTGSGVRMLAAQIEAETPRELWLPALKRVPVIARGVKTMAALRELEIPVTLITPSPHTWHELILALDAHHDLSVARRNVVLQEYGTPNRALSRALMTRGALVSRLLIYQWALPEDTTLLLSAINDIIEDRYDLTLWTNGAQVWHLFQLAYHHGIESELRQAMQRLTVASIGPACSEALREWEVTPTLEPLQPRMADLVRAAALFSTAPAFNSSELEG